MYPKCLLSTVLPAVLAEGLSPLTLASLALPFMCVYVLTSASCRSKAAAYAPTVVPVIVVVLGLAFAVSPIVGTNQFLEIAAITATVICATACDKRLANLASIPGALAPAVTAGFILVLALSALPILGAAQACKVAAIAAAVTCVMACENGPTQLAERGCGAAGGVSSGASWTALLADPIQLFSTSKWGAGLAPRCQLLREAATRALLDCHLFYQNLWFSRKYRRSRRKVKHFFEKPLKLRRYWFLTLKIGSRFETAWLGLPFRQYPHLRLANTLFGAPVRRVLNASLTLLAFFNVRPLGRGLYLLLRWAGVLIKRLWDERPSARQSFVDAFQPDAPAYFRRGLRLVPPSRRRRLINLISDMEGFGGRGSSLLIFMFLVWSFFARVLLIMCFSGLF